MSSQGQQSGKGGQGYGMQPGYGQGYGQSPYQMNPAQQGSFFSNGGSNRPQFQPMQTLPYQMPRMMDGPGSQFGAGMGGFNGTPGALTNLYAAMNSQFGTSAGGLNGTAVSPTNLGPASAPPSSPYQMPSSSGVGSGGNPNSGVQTFQNGAYANWGQPTIQNPTAPSVLPPNPGVTTFQNMYQNAGTLPQGSNPFPGQNTPYIRPFTNGY